MTTELILIRHGETEWNREGRFQGRQDSPLTPEGIVAARQLGRHLQNAKIDKLYCSSLGRARHTAELIGAEMGLLPHPVEGLQERSYGILEGEHRRDRRVDYEIPGGESSRDCYERINACIDELVAGHPGKRILMVSHGGTISRFLKRVLEIPLASRSHFACLNTAVNLFHLKDERWTLRVWGDRHFL